MSSRKKLGEMLLQGKIIDEVQLKAALGHQKKWGCRLGTALLELGFVTEDSLTKFLSSQTHVAGIDLINARIAEDVFKTIPKDVASKYGAIPVALKDTPGRKTLVVAMSNPTDLNAIDELEFLTTCKIEPKISPESSIKKRLQQYGEEFLTSYKASEPPPMDLTEEDAAVNKIVEEKLSEPEVVSQGQEQPIVVVADAPVESSAGPPQEEPVSLTEVTLEEEPPQPADASSAQEPVHGGASSPHKITAREEVSSQEYSDIVVVTEGPQPFSTPPGPGTEPPPQEVQEADIPVTGVPIRSESGEAEPTIAENRDFSTHIDTLRNELTEVRMSVNEIQKKLLGMTSPASPDATDLNIQFDIIRTDLAQVWKAVGDITKTTSHTNSIETTLNELKDLIQVLLNYLIDKGIFSKEELVSRLKKGA